MVIWCNALTKQVFRSTDTFRGFFLNLMISLPWYMGWRSQCAARRARSHFKGCLASLDHNHRYYIIWNDGIKATIGQGLFDTSNPGDLSDVGLNMFLVDIVLLIKWVHKPFQVAQEPKELPFHMSEAIRLQNGCSSKVFAFRWMKCHSKVIISKLFTAKSVCVSCDQVRQQMVAAVLSCYLISVNILSGWLSSLCVLAV